MNLFKRTTGVKSWSLRYLLLTYRLDQLWLPAAFWALFAVMAVILRGGDQVYNLARGLIGGVLPLLGGIMAAYVVLDDPALELQFATPSPAHETLIERLGLTFVIIAITALSYQLFLMALGVDLSRWTDPWSFQLTWSVPSLVFLALGSAAAFALGNCVSGAMLVGLVWIVEFIVRDWFLGDRWLQYVMVFMALIAPEHPNLRANLIVLSALAALLFVLAWALLKKQERYL
ncbi:MAG: hypothetical protein M1132_11390 [Chloroflexi bacterium]|nr:hypothetical protein [Chloroflexota bacterium]